MYKSFPENKVFSHRKIYNMLLVPKYSWGNHPTISVSIPFSGILSRNKDGKRFDLFSMYYTSEKKIIRMENIVFRNENNLLNKGEYKELFFNHLFFELINFKNTMKKDGIIVSSKDPFAVTQMLNFNFKIRSQKLAVDSELYIGAFINGHDEDKDGPNESVVQSRSEGAIFCN